MSKNIRLSDAGPVVLVTGASRGIGRSTAERFLESGAVVHAHFNTGEEEAKQLAAQYENCTTHQADFGDSAAVEGLITALKGVRLDVLVNNAGIFEMEDLDDFDYAQWQRIFDINLNAPLRLSLGLCPQINKGGSIVNVASLDGMVGSFVSTAYSASKAALINLTLSLGNSLGQRGIRVNAISPGWISTGMATPESDKAVNITPLGRNGAPAEVASLITFLASPDASFLNGANIVIDGGFANVDYIMLQESKRGS